MICLSCLSRQVESERVELFGDDTVCAVCAADREAARKRQNTRVAPRQCTASPGRDELEQWQLELKESLRESGIETMRWVPIPPAAKPKTDGLKTVIYDDQL